MKYTFFFMSKVLTIGLLLTISTEIYVSVPDSNHESKEYLATFMRTQFRSYDYIERVLPTNFFHIAKFLEYGHHNIDDRVFYGRSILSTYRKLLIGVPYISAHAFAEWLDDSVALCKPYVSRYKHLPYLKTMMGYIDSQDYLQDTIHGLLFVSLSEEYDFFRTQPVEFIAALSRNIYDITQEALEIEKFKHTLHLFLETVVQRLVWSVDDELLWQKVVSIGQQLDSLSEESIVDATEARDDLKWALVYRFGYFVDTMAERLPLSFYKQVKDAIMHDEVSFLQPNDQDDFLMSKKEQLLFVLSRAEAKRLAYENGIVLSV